MAGKSGARPQEDGEAVEKLGRRTCSPLPPPETGTVRWPTLMVEGLVLVKTSPSGEGPYQIGHTRAVVRGEEE